MKLVESLAYFLPLCLFVGATTALTKGDGARRVVRLAIKYTLGLAIGISLLALLLLLLNVLLKIVII